MNHSARVGWQATSVTDYGQAEKIALQAKAFLSTLRYDVTSPRKVAPYSRSMKLTSLERLSGLTHGHPLTCQDNG
jgi:hypothetical protein